MIESYLYEYFLAMVEEGSTLKVSEKLHVSQPSVTRAIQKLESELGLELFDRKPNRLSLNESGRILAEYIKDAVSIDARILAKAKELKRRSLTINVLSTAPGPSLEYPNFFFFQKDDNPHTFEIKSEQECVKAVINGLCDVAFINSEGPLQENIHVEKLFVEKLFVSLPKKHFLAKKDGGVSFSDLDGQSFLIVRELGIWDEVIAKKLKRSRFFRQKNMDELQEIVSASSIPSFVTNISLRFRDDTDRVFVPITDVEAAKTFYGICKKENIRLLERIKAEN